MHNQAELLTRPQSNREELANSLSHGVGMLLGLAAAPVLISTAFARDDLAGTVGVSIFAASLVLLYLVSMLYHAMPIGRAKEVFKTLDHISIFILIAGTYMPFALGVLRGAWGWTLFGLVWGLAAIGIALKIIYGAQHSRLSTSVYLAMGWLIVIAVKPMWEQVPAWGLFWLLAGGIAYTAGVPFFARDDRVPYAHFIWHLFVLAGSGCHLIAVLWYSAKSTGISIAS